MKKSFVIACFILIAAFQFGFSDMFISYKSGDCRVDLKGTGRWREAVLDMKLEPGSILKTGADGLLEVTIDEETVSIGQSSLVKLSDILSKLGEKKKAGVVDSVMKYAKAAAKGKGGPGSTTIAGVRARKSGGEELEWFEEAEEGFNVLGEFDSGKTLFDQGRYTRAVEVFSGLIDLEEAAPIRSEVSYYMGSALFYGLRYSDALTYLKMSVSDKSAYFYEPALIHYSLAQYFLKDYEGAIDGFSSYARSFPEGEMKPYAIFMIGKSYKETGNKREAERYFLEIKDKYSDTDVYSNAMEEMKGM